MHSRKNSESMSKHNSITSWSLKEAFLYAYTYYKSMSVSFLLTLWKYMLEATASQMPFLGIQKFIWSEGGLFLLENMVGSN